ncbi:RNA methyltransferase, TrmH family, group 3 [Paenibacillus vortex V453]|uniref:23S rRNA (Guanosine(2251)-2'-O)-methyltransferase RlmB n=2 Tax=Paenibacillus TaxID=44249 RepID=A0A163HSZ7_9BACL|nr:MULTISPECIES: 23S rRNA (guanosine(2251)-2'-O)-methyltransferase RlmB [Paenibacillus]ANA79683.1 23S rRNA (guanosine(2251)-2'-O)-methyltransferase RlmB [Paenibacillus glucanolyticus]AVV56319.1 23S rRNA (guanosine(2251)-2'-O)-methyltransferase RlmB [Paenibacillus glucanolyticus]AWP25527.1 23S rRNA (guanosine(2251)-2'-O)-methyltransferase RlmB [Paenibacillus sp. Cedars]EFU38286.1 RNA methyltransferase, TrmH family, group 3 [Paenibacillus vortex V453]ETT40966.1 TrmH family RNA methyltransferase 
MLQEEEVVAGKHSVTEALKSGRTINKIWIAENAQKHLTLPIIAEAKKLGIVIQHVDKRKLDQMVPGVQHQGVVAQAAPYAYVEVEDLLKVAEEKGEPPFLLLLDEIEDPHNLGSILRTADCTGAHGVVLPKRRSAQVTATVSKTSAGAVEYVPVARVTNLGQTIDQLKEMGVWVVGTVVDAVQELYDTEVFDGPVAIVIGNESKGMGRLIREKCDVLVKLPMAGKINSLNASVAAGVVMYEVLRRRRLQG